MKEVEKGGDGFLKIHDIGGIGVGGWRNSGGYGMVLNVQVCVKCVLFVVAYVTTRLAGLGTELRGVLVTIAYC